MTQEDKVRRIVTACVSAATVLLVFLLGFLIYQWITIATKNKKIDKLEKEIAAIEQQIAEGQDDVAFYEDEVVLRYQYDVLKQKLDMIKG